MLAQQLCIKKLFRLQYYELAEIDIIYYVGFLMPGIECHLLETLKGALCLLYRMATDNYL